MLMKKVFLLLAVVLAFQRLHAQSADNESFAPLLLYTNGPGKIVPFDGGEMLEAGQKYVITAVPDAHFEFSSWQPVNVFIITQTNFDAYGNPILPPDQSIVPSVVPTYIYRADLQFTMQDAVLITPDGANPNIVQAFGWQANFVPRNHP